MEKIQITEKGFDFLVDQDLNIYRPAFTTKSVRTRHGKQQEFAVNFLEKKLSQAKDRNGYLYVSIKLGDVRPKFAAHRIIAKAFVPGFFDGLHTNHINGVKTDNRPENLEWVTNEENVSHAWKTGLCNLRGENQPSHKLSQKQVIEIRKALRFGITANSLAVITGVSPSTIYLIEKGKRWASLAEE
jgi:hypothetical protein